MQQSVIDGLACYIHSTMCMQHLQACTALHHASAEGLDSIVDVLLSFDAEAGKVCHNVRRLHESKTTALAEQHLLVAGTLCAQNAHCLMKAMDV